MKNKPKFKIKKPEFDNQKINIQDRVFCDLVFDSTSNFLEYIKNSVPEDAFEIRFGGGYGYPYLLSFNRTETDEEYNLRHDKFLDDLNAWEQAFKQHEKYVKDWEDLQRQNKKIKDARYSDPEYIEYLRLKAKMKERGLEE